MSERRWTSALTEIARFGRRGDLAVTIDDDRGAVVPRAVADFLFGARRASRTHDENVSLAIAQSSGALTRAAAHALVRALEESGLLQSESAIRARLRAARTPSPGPLTALAISTCDRPEALESCLASHLSRARERGSTARVLVADDSRRAENRAANRRVIATHAKAFGVEVDCLGRIEKERMVHALAKAAAIPPQILRFLLGDALGSGYTPGANRNAALLALRDRRFLIVDDDTLSSGLEPPDAKSSPVFAETAPWPPFRFASARASPVPRDLLGASERFLGKSAGDLFVGSTHAALESATHLLRSFQTTPRVAAVLFGMLGDHGMAGPWSILWEEGPGRAEMLRSVKSYRAATERAAALWAVSRPTICRRVALCSGAALALDNTRSLPPFAPVGRSEDQLFATMLELCEPSALFAVSPVAVTHRPNAARVFASEARWEGLGVMNLNSTLALLLRTRCTALFVGPGVTRSAANNQRILGEHLLALSKTDVADLHAHLRDAAVARNVALIHSLHALLERHRKRPHFWAADVERQLRVLEEATRLASAGLPNDLLMATGRGSRLQPILRLLGTALIAWPALRDAASDLHRKEGLRCP